MSTELERAPAGSRRALRIAHTRLDPFPRTFVGRLIMRVVLALPLLAATLVVYLNGTPIAGTPNAVLMNRVAQIDWSRADVTWLGQIYPPISTLIAAIVPGSRLGLGVLGSLAAGIFLQKLIEIMVQRRFHRSTSVILTVALAANPLFFYTATENFAGFLGLMFFGLAVTNTVRFVSWGNTEAGFRAGILFMLATLSDLSGLLYLVTAAIAVPFLTFSRQGQRGARLSTILVIVYPTVAAVSTLMLLNLVFLGNPIGSVGEQLLQGVGYRFASLSVLFTTPSGWILVAPVVSAWLCAVIVGRWKSIPVSTLVFVAIMGAYVLGLIPTGSAGNTFIMMTLLAMALIPTAKRPFMALLLDGVALLQIGIAWAGSFTRPIIVDWMSALWSALTQVQF